MLTHFLHPAVLTIAGSDSSGGAGVQADLKTMTSLGCYGMTVITALTAQNTQGVQGVYPVSTEVVLAQLNAVFEDIPPVTVKIGMLHDQALIEGLYHFLKDRNVRIVLDPVMVATSGDVLLEPDSLQSLQTLLFPLASLITPNIHEIDLISGKKNSSKETMGESALAMAHKWGSPFLVKGGDLQGCGTSSDVLAVPGSDRLLWFESERVETRNTHGTGCTLSSAVASHLALGYSLDEAVSLSKKYISAALEHGKNQSWGQGRGPVNHMWNLKKSIRR
ncbi:bifunctional hydroxymethylpyrimidine kinase/phosphomethylpyrimidine kinase [Oceanispirochaeta crateris]|uniref:hydroxymethylpyrimidine kinase n=1 Tax=Oceanispirochaeta crateris TaxID=2518645 RepID=A0A5C1QL98_9SPIO|nr:bifunctional hydroxymethylpyrimidine kinase/phosphomethylpyrimidine kinase [Oceanispirochaeta crateris]